MKHYGLQIIFILVFLIAMDCAEDKNPVDPGTERYIGTWHWVKTVGGVFPRVKIPGDSNIIKINYDKNSRYRLFRNDTLKVSANYTIGKAEHDRDKISYTNIKTYNYYFDRDSEYGHVSSDTLEIWDGQIDGYFSWYLKNK